MTQQIQEHKRLVERRISTLNGPVRMDELIDHLRREVSLVRRDDPSLDDYHLHDIKLSFQTSEILLQIDFRK
ncbi:hypothetical protein [Effusibacillus lacus]|uniref:Uncharacterized protein n=1 Tax=Effusibacillus lacus TaxID=1348429 RepID=A0A292YL96_9BACL|nr:hypothetical protein [Effusibacillus lacus]TCS72845.1 hypothetical protein EDD64_12060 [Effusibacillus lacus]GAX89230.1 hypothetical protein EFBL_0848 [Effusibacillus lacus]